MFSSNVLAASESQTLAIAAKAKVMQSKGVDVVSLSTGEPDFPTPTSAKNAAIDAINANFSHYTHANGIVELREAVAERFKTKNGIQSATADTILISTGAKQSIFNALLALCNSGDTILIPSPYWVSYPAMVTMCGATPVFMETTFENRFLVTPETLEQSLTPTTKAVILNSPSNPTGTMYSKEQLQALVNVLAKHSCYIITDEIYERINFGSIDHCSLGSFPEIAERVITINGVSKAYAMTGWRIGFLHCQQPLFKEIAKAQGQITSNPNSIAQKAALAALKFADNDVETMNEAFRKRSELMCSLLGEIKDITFLKPDGAFYVFVNITKWLQSTSMTSAQFCESALDGEFLAITPGEAFGLEGYVRFSFAASDAIIIEGVKRFKRALERISS
jgi:aspartate aminotransferase